MAKALMCSDELLARDLSGHTVVVTGANSGIGYVTAKQLAQQGAHVVLACRRPEEGEARAEEIRAGQSAASVEVMRLDLGELASVRAFAEAFLAKHDKLHGLINNAGVMNTPESKTKDGFEMQIGVNHLGHFALTEALIPALERGAPSRVICVSSCYHDVAMGRKGEIDLDDLHFERRDYDGWEAYAQSKLANLLHARGLAKRLGDKGILSVSVHPGWVRTDLARHSMPLFVQNTIMRPIFAMMGMIGPWEGAQTTLHTYLAPDIINGAFYSQTGAYRDKSKNRGGWPLESPNPSAHDDALVDALWDKSVELVA